jgi:hypothetical protein
MTLAEAKKLAELARTVGGGCIYCAEAFINRLNEARWCLRSGDLLKCDFTISQWNWHPDPSKTWHAKKEAA